MRTMFAGMAACLVLLGGCGGGGAPGPQQDGEVRGSGASGTGSPQAPLPPPPAPPSTPPPPSAPPAAPPPPAPAPAFPVLQRGEILEPFDLQEREYPEWAASQRLYAVAQGDSWSPFAWAQNASVLSSVKRDPERLQATAQALLAELWQHTDHSADGSLVRFDYDFGFTNHTLRAPWRSAFGQAVVAIGLMQIQGVAPHLVPDPAIDAYLAPLWPLMSFPDTQGYRWFSEYIAPQLPGGHVDVVNGHFFAVAAMYEWSLRSGSTAYAEPIRAGLDTLEHGLPAMIQDGYFSYARGYPELRDYGQLRAVNVAAAACKLREAICPIAQEYKALYGKWQAAK